MQRGAGRRSTRTRCARPRRRARRSATRSRRPSCPTRRRRSSSKAALEHARCMREHGIDIPGPDVRRGRRRADPDRARSGIEPGIGQVQGGRRRRAATRCPGPAATTDERGMMKRARRRRRGRAGRGRGRCVAAATSRRVRRPPTPGAGDGGGRAARPRRPREPRPGRSATPTPATLGAGVSGTLTALRDPGAIDHPRALALLRRRRAGRVPALRHAAGLARLRAVDDRRRGRPPARAQPARARLRPGRRRRRLGLGRRPPRSSSSSATAGSTTTARSSRGEVVFRDGAIRIGEAKAAVGDRSRPGQPLAEISSAERRVTVDLDARASSSRASATA